MAKEREEMRIVQGVLQVLLRQGICYGDEEVLEVKLDELAEWLAPELGESIEEARERIAAALDRHPEILSKRVRQGKVIYETTVGTCREAAQKTSP